MKPEYVLRERDKEELERLRFQHEVWSEETNIAINRSGVRTGDTIVDLGSGPGYLSFDLLPLVGAKGTIFCVDNSDTFLNFIDRRDIPNIHTIKADIREDLGTLAALRTQRIHKVFCRWVLMFIDNVDGIIEEIYTLLDHGGKFISMEYFRFEHIDIFPHSTHFNTIYRNVRKLLASKGGNPDIGGEVYSIMTRKGFRNIQTFPVYKTGKAGSPLWNWLAKTNANHKNLVESELITPEELEAYHNMWNERSQNNASFITAPPLMITIGEK